MCQNVLGIIILVSRSRKSGAKSNLLHLHGVELGPLVSETSPKASPKSPLFYRVVDFFTAPKPTMLTFAYQY